MTLPDTTLVGMAAVLGPLPPGDAPAAWYMSQSAEVLAQYDDYVYAREGWNRTMAKLLEISKLPADIQFITLGQGFLKGLVPPAGVTKPPRWWRIEDKLLVPRKRTRAEKASEVNELWALLQIVPQPQLPGLPDTLWWGSHAYAPTVRKPGQAVLVFLAHSPEKATQPFEMGPEWHRLKVSTFHLLRERQHAASQVFTPL